MKKAYHVADCLVALWLIMKVIMIMKCEYFLRYGDEHCLHLRTGQLYLLVDIIYVIIIKWEKPVDALQIYRISSVNVLSDRTKKRVSKIENMGNLSCMEPISWPNVVNWSIWNPFRACRWWSMRWKTIFIKELNFHIEILAVRWNVSFPFNLFFHIFIRLYIHFILWWVDVNNNLWAVEWPFRHAHLA